MVKKFKPEWSFINSERKALHGIGKAPPMAEKPG